MLKLILVLPFTYHVYHDVSFYKKRKTINNNGLNDSSYMVMALSCKT